MKKAIYMLYEDSVSPMTESEREWTKERRYVRETEESFDRIEKFAEALEEEKGRELSALIKKHEEIRSEWEGLVHRRCFARGFSLGMRLAIEAFEQ